MTKTNLPCATVLLCAAWFALAGMANAQEPGVSPAAWALALPGGQYHFPEDHAAHPDYKTEWWYFTGDLRDGRGHDFGYEVTFFRQGVIPPGRLSALFGDGAPHSRFVQSDFKFAHFAVSDLSGRRFRFTQRMTRGAFGEAGFAGSPPGSLAPGSQELLAWLDDWRLAQEADGAWHLTARAPSPTPMTIDLALRPSKPPVIHGAEGVSQKATGTGNASHYYSFTRLATTGALAFGDNATPAQVSGESWFDHEWASNALAADQLGWNWFCFQFDDGTELMLYAMRKRDGTIDAVSAGTFIDATGGSTHLERNDFRLVPQRVWQSANTGATYPLDWEVAVPRLELNFVSRAQLDDQELVLPPISYWEGAVRAEGTRDGRPLAGRGYMELTGYAGELTGLQDRGADGDRLRTTPR